MRKTLLYTLFMLLAWMQPLCAAEVTVVHAGWLLAVPGPENAIFGVRAVCNGADDCRRAVRHQRTDPGSIRHA